MKKKLNVEVSESSCMEPFNFFHKSSRLLVLSVWPELAIYLNTFSKRIQPQSLVFQAESQCH